MRKRWIAVALIATMVLGSTQVANATSLSDAQKKKNQAQSDLDSVNSEINDIESKQTELQGEIDETNAELVDILVDIDVTRLDLDAKTLELSQMQTELAKAKTTEAEQLNSMKERICYMYENGDSSLFTALIESDSFAQVLNKLENFSTVYDFDRELLDDYQETKALVEELVENVSEEEAELEYLKETLEEQEAELEATLAVMQDQMDDYDTQLANAEALADQYRDTITEMNQVIASAVAASSRRSSSSSGSSGSTAAYGSATGTSYSSKGQQVANYACQFVGNPYVYGGTSLTNGCDCSGFVMSVYAHFGVSLPHSSSSLRSCGTHVTVSEIMPGDIVCYSGHVGIYVGGGSMVDASNPKSGIKYTNIYYRTILDVRRIFT